MRRVSGAAWLATFMAQAQPLEAPNDTAPNDTAPNDTAPNDTAPNDTAPNDTAPNDSDARAKRHWHSGMAYLEEGDPTSALAAFNKAYQLSQRPEILLAIAVAHEQRGDFSRAIATLRNYLTQTPHSAKTDAVHAKLEELQTKYDAELVALRRARAREESQTSDSDGTATTTPDPGKVFSPQSNGRATVLWTSLGVGTAAAAGAVVLGVAAQREYNALEERCQGRCASSDTLQGRSLALTSTLLTGLAALGLGIGTWLVITEPSQPIEQVGWLPELELTASPSGSYSRIRWGF